MKRFDGIKVDKRGGRCRLCGVTLTEDNGWRWSTLCKECVAEYAEPENVWAYGSGVDGGSRTGKGKSHPAA
ncbi:hypothetical protein [Alicyclobacillus macrosporangiidus]|uniref:hypothetical protein n=1 Tax=Alicyclobacillus macrosporangiidus TaxID=392015 RepID=UPI0004953B4F|nr:hypothetical protein [Alicyclobacillus macrosporangiidus]